MMEGTNYPMLPATVQQGIDPNLLLAQTGGGGFGGNNIWPWLLLLTRGGFGLGPEAATAAAVGQGVRSSASLQDLNAMQNALGQSTQAGFLSTQEQIDDAEQQVIESSRRSADNFMETQRNIDNFGFRNLSGQADIKATMQNCCCDIKQGIAESRNQANVAALNTINAIQAQGCATREAIKDCCCETQKTLLEQTNTLAGAIHAEGEATRAQATNFRMSDQATEICDLKGRLSNCEQTAAIDARIGQQTSTILHHLHPYMHGNGFVPPGQSATV